MQHVDGLSRKAYALNDFGVIPDIIDDTWLPLIKEKVVAPLVTERAKRIIRKPKCYRMDSESNTEVIAQCKAKGKALPKRPTMDPLIGGQPKSEPIEQGPDRDILLRMPSHFQPIENESEINRFYHGDEGDDDQGNEEEITADEEAELEDVDDNEPTVLPLVDHSYPPGQILNEQTKDKIVGKLLFAAQNDQLHNMTKEQFE
jgi:hypothetical protein